VLFTIVLVLRLWAATRLSGSDFVVPDSGDMRFYYDWAGRILRGIPQEGAFYGLPGYPYLLALLLAFPSSIPFQVLLVQCVLDAGTATLLFGLARRFRPDRAGVLIGILSAGLWAFHTSAQAYALSLMPSTWGTFLLWALAAGMLCIPGTRPLSWLALGVATGLSALLISNLLMLGLFGLGCLFLWCEKVPAPSPPVRLARTLRITSALALFAGIALGTAPVWGFHRFVAREPVFLSAHAGLNFFIGNNPLANGYPRTPPGMRASQRGMLRDSITLAENEVGRPLSRAEISNYWEQKARNFIRLDRPAWLRLQALKLFNFWNQFRYDDLGIVALLSDHRILLPGPSWGAIAVAGLPGLILGVALVPASRPLAAVVLLHMASLLPVFVTERYRMLALPGLCLFAAWFAVTTVLQLRSGAWRFPALAAAGLLVTAPLILWPCREPRLLALEPYNSGVHALARGDWVRAEPKLVRAEALVPDNEEVQFALGNLRLDQGDSLEARSRYRRALELNPRHEGAWNNLGVIALREKRWELAEYFCRASLEIDADDAKTLMLLASSLDGQGRTAETPALRQRALELDPRAENLTLP